MLPLKSLESALGYLCLQWAAAKLGESKIDVDRLQRMSNRSVVKDWSRMIPFENFLSSVHLFPAYTDVHSLTTELTWPCSGFHTDSALRESGVSNKRVHDQKNTFWNLVEPVRKKKLRQTLFVGKLNDSGRKR